MLVHTHLSIRGLFIRPCLVCLPLGYFVRSSFGHLPGPGVCLTAVPQVQTAFLGVEKHQAGTRAQTGTLAIHLHQRGLPLCLTTDAEQPPAA